VQAHGYPRGGNINPQGTSMFEPIGGSAPKYTNQGVINPLAGDLRRANDAGFPGETRGQSHRDA